MPGWSPALPGRVRRRFLLWCQPCHHREFRMTVGPRCYLTLSTPRTSPTPSAPLIHDFSNSASRRIGIRVRRGAHRLAGRPRAGCDSRHRPDSTRSDAGGEPAFVDADAVSAARRCGGTADAGGAAGLRARMVGRVTDSHGGVSRVDGGLSRGRPRNPRNLGRGRSCSGQGASRGDEAADPDGPGRGVAGDGAGGGSTDAPRLRAGRTGIQACRTR